MPTLNTQQSFDDACHAIAQEIANVVIAKQHDYGHENILGFGERGLVVRLWDKISRLKNLIWVGQQPKNESVSDTFTDVAGYAIIGLMLQRELFTLELKERYEETKAV